MSQTMPINGTAMNGRTGSNSFGSLTRTVNPPQNTQLGTLWGWNLMEIAGRAKGLAGYGTYDSTGTARIDFPANYFNTYLPIVNAVNGHVVQIEQLYAIIICPSFLTPSQQGLTNRWDYTLITFHWHAFGV